MGLPRLVETICSNASQFSKGKKIGIKIKTNDTRNGSGLAEPQTRLIMLIDGEMISKAGFPDEVEKMPLI